MSVLLVYAITFSQELSQINEDGEFFADEFGEHRQNLSAAV